MVAVGAIMEGEDNQKFSSAMPVFERLDWLDRLLCYMEEKQNLPQKHLQVLNRFKRNWISNASLCPLHSRKFNSKLSLEMEEGYLSRSSSSTVPLPENIKQGVPAKQNKEVSRVEKQRQVINPEKPIHEACIGKPEGFVKGRKSKGALSSIHGRKWLRWFQLGC